MPLRDPHAYASRSAADLQEANPADPNFKAKSMNKKPKAGFGKDAGPTSESSGKVGDIEGVVSRGTGPGFDTNPGPTGLGEKLRKLVKMRGRDVTDTSYDNTPSKLRKK